MTSDPHCLQVTPTTCHITGRTTDRHRQGTHRYTPPLQARHTSSKELSSHTHLYPKIDVACDVTHRHSFPLVQALYCSVAVIWEPILWVLCNALKAGVTYRPLPYVYRVGWWHVVMFTLVSWGFLLSCLLATLTHSTNISSGW